MTDITLYVLRHTRYQHLNDARAADAIAYDLHLSADSVRGRLARVDKIAGSIALAKYMATNVDDQEPDKARQQEVISDSEYVLATHLSILKQAKALFVSDIHVPYTRWDALNLVTQIIHREQPDFISAQNDMLDNTGWAWEDIRNIEDRRWSASVTYMRRVEKQIYGIFQDAAPGTMLLGLMGNHDAWYYSHMRENAAFQAEYDIADYMEKLYNDSHVLQFSDGRRENYIRLNEGLVWWHGQFVAKSPVENAKNTIGQFVEDGVASTVIVGHTHRPVHMPGQAVGYTGVDFYNAPCLSTMEKVPYLKRDPKGWGLGCVLSEFDTKGRKSRSQLIVFYEDGKKLCADVNGEHLETRLDKSSPI